MRQGILKHSSIQESESECLLSHTSIIWSPIHRGLKSGLNELGTLDQIRESFYVSCWHLHRSSYGGPLLETFREGRNEPAGARLRRHFESAMPSTVPSRVPATQKASASPILLISTLAAEGYGASLHCRGADRRRNSGLEQSGCGSNLACPGRGANQPGSERGSGRRPFHQLLARRHD